RLAASRAGASTRDGDAPQARDLGAARVAPGRAAHGGPGMSAAVADRASPRRLGNLRLVLAAGFGGLAEAALWYLPASQVARGVALSGVGPLVWFWAFVPGFTATVIVFM